MNKCEICNTTDLPGGSSSCAYGRDCMICEDCVCRNCDDGQYCEKHCLCNICAVCDENGTKYCDNCVDTLCDDHFDEHECY